MPRKNSPHITAEDISLVSIRMTDYIDRAVRNLVDPNMASMGNFPLIAGWTPRLELIQQQLIEDTQE